MSDNLAKRMSQKERRRKQVLEEVIKKKIKATDAAKHLGMSIRHLKRIKACYRAEGEAGLIHGHRGKRSGHRYPEDYRQEVMERYLEKYSDFGPTLAAEKLTEEGKKVHRETLRLWLKKEGLWEAQRQRRAHRRRRERRGRYGEMLQMDGSIHQWFSGIEERQCLMNLVDDATSKTMALMAEGETTKVAFLLLRWWIVNAGIPLSIYVDLKSLYVSPKSLKKKQKMVKNWLNRIG